MRKVISVAALLLFFLCACATTNTALNWNNLTPKGKAALALSTYNDAYDSYKQEVQMPNLSEQSKEMLREKKKALRSLYEILRIYTRYVNNGVLPPQKISEALVNALKPFAVIR